MRATAVVLAAAIRLVYAQDIDDIPPCALDCLGASSSEFCYLRKNPNCACGLGTYDSMRTQWAFCTQSACGSEGITFEDVWPPFAAYCVANGWLDASETDVTSTMTLTRTRAIIVTRTRSATFGGDDTHTTSNIETSTLETNVGSTTAQAAIPTTQSTSPIAGITPTAEPTSTTDGDNSDSSSSSGELSTGVKAGIGAGAALMAMLALILLFWWRKRKKASLSDGNNEDNITPELGGGDKSNRYELDSYTTSLEAGKKSPAIFPTQQNQIMAELDATPCASPEPNINERHTVAPSVEQDAVSPEVVSTISLPKLPLSSATNRMSPPIIGDRTISSPEPSIVDMAELEHLLHEEQLLRDRRQTLEQLQRIQADELALGERIRTLRQSRS
ncbi:hypothetical protein CFIO01_05624 [Colletotrichum fioriniae PJ7]|uniref:Extracellular membrane protein CFEM domain-containing protein n=1 Tax=Colletotrichum fioriniae PJ7 TaxID=1445577 RepID=A0A010RU66_9PEZI|nr:hypothetical protein CFIO01_05624 [Colletotrichum fioriniae PJ7]